MAIYKDKEFDIDFNKSVLIVVDMIKGFTDVGMFKNDYVKNIAKDIRNVCNKFKTIVAINDNHEESDIEFNNYPKHCLSNSVESEICDELSDVKFTNVLFKNSTNGFFADNFLDVFNKYIKEKYDFVVVGCCTDICILQLCLTFKGYLNSINSDSNIVVVRKLVDTYDSQQHNREYLSEVSFYFMENMGVRLVDCII